MRILLSLLLAAVAAPLAAQTSLHQRLAAIAAESHGTVSVSCSLPGVRLDCDLNPRAHAPMQSVFKLPLALAALHEVDAGRLSLDQPIPFSAADLMPGTHSPMQDKYPHGGVSVPLRDMLRYSVGESDNVATDIILRVVGGPPSVQAYLASLGIANIKVRDGEHGLGKDHRTQYRNWAEPAAMVLLLRRIADDSPFKPATRAFLEDIMSTGSTGANRIRALLPAGTVLAHKTGTSGTDAGLSPATNDVGLITLPGVNGSAPRRLALAIFVTDSRAQTAVREHVIAAIAKAIYDEATSK